MMSVGVNEPETTSVVLELSTSTRQGLPKKYISAQRISAQRDMMYLKGGLFLSFETKMTLDRS